MNRNQAPSQRDRRGRLAPILVFFFMLIFLLTGCRYNTNVTHVEEKVEPKSTEKRETSREKEISPTEVSFFAAGDYMCHMPQVHAARRGEGYDFSENLLYVKDRIERADIAMVNLETTLTYDSNRFSGFPTFASPAAIATAMKGAGFDIISTANNHSFDKGVKGVESTLNILSEHELFSIGTQITETKPLIQEVNGMKLGFLSYTYGINGFESSMENSEVPYAVNLLSEEQIEKDCAYLHEQGVEAIIAFVHWGNEYQEAITEGQKHFATFLAEHGVYLIFGSHPRINQTVGAIPTEGHTTFVAYSMGNFVSNQRAQYQGTSKVESGLMVEAALARDEKGKITVSKFYPTPTYMDIYGDGEGRHYQVIPIEDALNDTVAIPRMESLRPTLQSFLANYLTLIPREQVVSGQ